MLAHLTYRCDKKSLREYFWKNYDKGMWHEWSDNIKTDEYFNDKPRDIWWKVFKVHNIANPIIKELGLEGMNVSPRFSYQFANTRLPVHVDIDNIVGLNMNLMDDHVPDIHLNNRPYFYECMLVDVGSIKHSVESVPYARLIFKLAIREPWDKIYNALKNKGWVDPDLTMCINPNLKEYISVAPAKENELWNYLSPNDMRKNK